MRARRSSCYLRWPRSRSENRCSRSASPGAWVENGAAGGYARSMTRGAEAQFGCHLRDIRAGVVGKHPPHVRPVVLGLVSGFAVAALTSAGFADTIDPRLIGGWTGSARRWPKIFEQ